MMPLQPNNEIYVITDGSKVGCGGIIWQLDKNNIPKVCAYVSVATTPAQKSWIPFNLELHVLRVVFRETMVIQMKTRL